MGKLYPGSGRDAMCCGRYCTVDPRLVSIEGAGVILEHEKNHMASMQRSACWRASALTDSKFNNGVFGRKKTLDFGVAGSPRPVVVIGVMTVVVLLTLPYSRRKVYRYGTSTNHPVQPGALWLYCAVSTVLYPY